VQTHMPAAALQLVWALCRAHYLLARTEDHPRSALLRDVWLPPPHAADPFQRRALVRPLSPSLTPSAAPQHPVFTPCSFD
jgi:hypothetical protein